MAFFVYLCIFKLWVCLINLSNDPELWLNLFSLLHNKLGLKKSLWWTTKPKQCPDQLPGCSHQAVCPCLAYPIPEGSLALLIQISAWSFFLLTFPYNIMSHLLFLGKNTFHVIINMSIENVSAIYWLIRFIKKNDY